MEVEEEGRDCMVMEVMVQCMTMVVGLRNADRYGGGSIVIVLMAMFIMYGEGRSGQVGHSNGGDGDDCSLQEW